jgi:AAA15 family ATPase/GTPase
MSENFKDKIQGLELENFTCFAKAKMEFSSGINVLIGENGTGKTHVLKVLYALYDAISKIKSEPDSTRRYLNQANFNPYSLVNDLALIFGTGVWLDLIRNKTIEDISFVASFVHESKFGLGFKNEKLSNLIFTIPHNTSEQKPLYIPPYEMLSTIGSFSSDKTYFDLITALNSKKNGVDTKILESLQNLIKIEVIKENDVFYMQQGEGKKSKAQLTANGINKIGQLIPLIQNGWLTKNTILFWDEPEVNLNPRYIAIVVKFLQTLAKNGVQIFVATHDYLLAHLLSLDAEYREQTDAPPMKFFSFYKGEDGTEIESADTIAGLQNNALLDEYAAYYDLEQSLFRKSMQNV